MVISFGSILSEIFFQSSFPLLHVPLLHSIDKNKYNLTLSEDDESNPVTEVVDLINSTFDSNPVFTDCFFETIGEHTMTLAKTHLDTALPEMVRELGYQVIN